MFSRFFSAKFFFVGKIFQITFGRVNFFLNFAKKNIYKMAKYVQKSMIKEGVEYFKTHLQLINPLFEEEKQLTRMEIVVLANFMAVDSEIARVDRFHREVRKEVKKKLNISNGGLSNYLRAFALKEFTDVNLADSIFIKPHIYPEEVEQFYQFKLLKGKENE